EIAGSHLGGVTDHGPAPDGDLTPSGVADTAATSYADRRQLLGEQPGTTTAEAFATVDPTNRAALLDPDSWIPERRELHNRLVDHAVSQARAFHEGIGGDPAIYAMRGNTAAGKTRAIRNVDGIGDVITALEAGGHPTINPDNFKVDLINADPDLTLSSNQVHTESSVLARRAQEQLLGAVNEQGDPLSFVLDKRFGLTNDVKQLHSDALASGRQLHLYDVD